MSESDSLFIEAPFFLVRAPFFPIQVFYELSNASDSAQYLLNLFHANSLLREAIAIASPSLYVALNQKELIGKEKDQAISSLFKYVSRMATRPTPFGLFSFVALGNWGDKSQAELDLEKVKKRARPDMEWLIKILDQVASDADLLQYFELKRNPLLEESMGRIILPYSRRENGKKDQVSIRASSLVYLILEKTKKPISAKDLISEILLGLPHLEAEKLLGVIRSLVKEEILFPTFFPSLLSDAPFQDVLANLSKSFSSLEAQRNLEDVEDLILLYNQTLPGEGEPLLLQLENKMKSQASVTTYLQVDSGYPNEITISQKIASELRQSLDLLWKLSSNESGMAHLRPYHEKFLEKYGTFRIVPLMEVLDENIGLGLPEYNRTPPMQEEPPPFHAWLTEQWVKCIYEGKREIVITEESVKQFGKDSPKSEAPSSFDVFCQIISDSCSAIDADEFLILIQPVSGAGDGGSTLGRFLDLFGNDSKTKLNQFFQEEQEVESSTLYVECSYFPSSPRSANVSIHPLLRKKVIDLGYCKSNENALSLDEIYVGATDQYLYLTLADGSKEIAVVALDALNLELAPPVVRFMRDISKDRYRLLRPFQWEKMGGSPFLPRVRYQKTILSPATWNLTLSTIEGSEKDDINVLISKISAWAKRWSLPQLVLMTVFDNRILLDLSQKFHLREIAHQLKTNPKKMIVLVEQPGTKEWLQSSKGNHVSECVVPFVKNKKYAFNPAPKREYQSIDREHRWKLPGDEWLFAKVYLNQKNEQRFLINHVAPFVQTLDEEIDKWFFIRYQDNKAAHIRLRFRVTDKEGLSTVFEKLHAWTKDLSMKGFIKEITISSYEREVERYGGVDAIEAAESAFFADSEFSLHLINEILLKKIDIPDYMIVALSLMEILKGCHLSLAEQVNFFSMMKLDKKLLEGFREWKNKLIPLVSLIFDEKLLLFNERPLFQEGPLARRRELLGDYFSKVKENKQSILTSILHMHCNRVLGTDGLLEQKAYAYASHLLSVFSQFSERLNISRV